MATPELLSESDVGSALPPGWSADGSWIRRTFEFEDFSEAFGFMTRCALAAETMNHHPNWSNVWATVEVSLQTHDAGGVTHLDIDLAKAMNRCAGE